WVTWRLPLSGRPTGMNLSRIRGKGNPQSPAGRRARLLDLDLLLESRSVGPAGDHVQARGQRGAFVVGRTGTRSMRGTGAIQAENLEIPRAGERKVQSHLTHVQGRMDPAREGTDDSGDRVGNGIHGVQGVIAHIGPKVAPAGALDGVIEGYRIHALGVEGRQLQFDVLAIG